MGDLMTARMICLGLLTALAAPDAAMAVRSDWAQADEAQMRLLLAGPQQMGIAGGIEILIEPGWHTYWRNPGEAGVPPVFDFSQSKNVASVKVLYPAPERLDDGGSVSLIYRNEVVFPLVIEPVEPGAPITLSVDATFGVCAEICIPTRASSAATLAPEAPADPLSEARVTSFAARVPGPAEPGRLEVVSTEAESDALVIHVRMPDSSYADLFADPPAGWYIGQPSFVSRAGGISRYRLSLAGKPENASLKGQTFRFVAVAGGDAIEQVVVIR
jgi:DsbC/DsbD-like thiol-disulfide interchange protein